MLPDLRTAGFRCQWTAAWLNVVPQLSGRDPPGYRRNKSTRCAGHMGAEPRGGEGVNLDLVSVLLELAIANVFRPLNVTQVCVCACACDSVNWFQ